MNFPFLLSTGIYYHFDHLDPEVEINEGVEVRLDDSKKFNIAKFGFI